MSFQERVYHWAVACFGLVIAKDRTERNYRFLEEALELVQSIGCTRAEAIALVDYVYGRPVGDKHQEMGGVMISLHALANANGLDVIHCGEIELMRCWEKIEAIREKQKRKPQRSPLPQ